MSPSAQTHARSAIAADTGIVPEAKSQIVVAARLEQRKRALQLIAGLDKLPANQWVTPAMRCATPASGESGVAATSARKVSACALIGGSSPRT